MMTAIISTINIPNYIFNRPHIFKERILYFLNNKTNCSNTFYNFIMKRKVHVKGESVKVR